MVVGGEVERGLLTAHPVHFQLKIHIILAKSLSLEPSVLPTAVVAYGQNTCIILVCIITAANVLTKRMKAIPCARRMPGLYSGRGIKRMTRIGV